VCIHDGRAGDNAMKKGELSVDGQLNQISEENWFTELEEAERARLRKSMKELEAMFQDIADHPDRHREQRVMDLKKEIDSEIARHEEAMDSKRKELKRLIDNFGKPADGLKL
jgi:hypothetical protein